MTANQNPLGCKKGSSEPYRSGCTSFDPSRSPSQLLLPGSWATERPRGARSANEQGVTRKHAILPDFGRWGCHSCPMSMGIQGSPHAEGSTGQTRVLPDSLAFGRSTGAFVPHGSTFPVTPPYTHTNPVGFCSSCLKSREKP